MNQNQRKTIGALIGMTFVTSALGVSAAGAAGNPFQLVPLESGYQLAENSQQSKTGEGKCGGAEDTKVGEGKCGGAEDAKAGEGEHGDAEDGKVGEGKCGGAKDAKTGEGKCGEGKCGGA